MKTVYLIVGESGSGKDAIADKLVNYGLEKLKSYTTREPRFEGEDTHEFIDKDFFLKMKEKNQIVAHTFFDGNHYFATKEQLKGNDIYVIDPDGVEYLKRHIKDFNFVTIYIKVDTKTRIKRMRERGHNEEEIINRLINDSKKFRNLTFDYAIPNYELNKAVSIIANIAIWEGYNG